MTAKKELSPDQLAKARHLYEQTLVPVSDIAASLKVSDAWLYKRIKDLNWRKRQSQIGDFHYARFLAEAEALAPAPAPPAELLAPTDREKVEQRSLAFTLRLQDAAERVLDAGVRIIATIRPGDHAEGERCARVVAVVAHAFRDVAHLTKPVSAAEAHEPAYDEDDDPVPRDLDEFRQELARRIRGFIEARRAELERAGAAEAPRIPGPALE
jgi:hypothetical protein